MKPLLVLTAVLTALSITLISFKTLEEKNTANVEKKEGLYIFVCSVPTAEYEYLGKVKKPSITMSSKPEELFNSLVSRCKKEYPQADGLIISNINMNDAQCVKFK
jgi:hypothetical protein